MPYSAPSQIAKHAITITFALFVKPILVYLLIEQPAIAAISPNVKAVLLIAFAVAAVKDILSTIMLSMLPPAINATFLTVSVVPLPLNAVPVILPIFLAISVVIYAMQPIALLAYLQPYVLAVWLGIASMLDFALPVKSITATNVLPLLAPVKAAQQATHS